MSIKNLKPLDKPQSITPMEQPKRFSSKFNRKALQNKPSEKLNYLMQLVNGLPPIVKSWDEIIQHAKELAGKPLKELGRDLYIFGEADPNRPLLAIEAAPILFADQVEELRDQAREYVGPMNFETARTLAFIEPYATNGYAVDQTMRSALIRYEQLIQARKILEEIAERGRNFKGYKYLSSITGKWPPFTTLTSTFSGLTISLNMNEEGRIGIEPNVLLDALLGAEVERIRQCPICNKIFWAGRIDQKACSKRCSNTMRVRRSRELNQERGTMYKRARIKKAEKNRRPSKDSKHTSKTIKSRK